MPRKKSGRKERSSRRANASAKLSPQQLRRHYKSHMRRLAHEKRQRFREKWGPRSLEIIRLYRFRDWSIRRLADRYGVHEDTMLAVMQWIPVRSKVTQPRIDGYEWPYT